LKLQFKKKNYDSTFSSEWDSEYFEMDDGTLFELILAANYLDISQLLEIWLHCKQAANIIKGKSDPGKIYYKS